MIKLSLVIPVYNVEKYLKQCLDSIIDQDIDKSLYEIIIINDGTNDRSMEIVGLFDQEHSNIKVYQQKNQGLSVVRNNGIAYSQGEYIWFIDSDDWIEKNCLKEVIQGLNGIDLMALGYIRKFEDAPEYSEIFSYSDFSIHTGKDLFLKGFKNGSQFYIYRREFLINKNLKFFPGIYSQDTDFTPKAVLNASSVKIFEKPIYYFLKHKGSVTMTYKPKRSYDYLTAAIELHKYSNNLPFKYKRVFNNIISSNIFQALNNGIHINSEEKKRFNDYLSKNRWLLKNMLLSTKLKFISIGILLYFCPKNYIKWYMILKLYLKSK